MTHQSENAPEKDEKPMRDVEIYKRDILSVTGKDKIIVQKPESPTTPLARMLKEQGHNDSGAIINNVDNVSFLQWEEYNSRITVEGPEIKKSLIAQGKGNDLLYMKDAEGISGNDFDAGSEPTGVAASIRRAIDRIEEPVRRVLGTEPSLGLDSDTVVLEGEKKDYQFTFNPPNPETGEKSSVTIQHIATGAENRFVGYEYLVFGGRGQENDPANYVKISSLKAEQEAKKAVENTQEKIAPQTGEASCHLPPSARGDKLGR